MGINVTGKYLHGNNPSVRRAQLDNRDRGGRLGSVTHLFIFTPGWELQWSTLCGRLTREKDHRVKDNHHLRLCMDCDRRLIDMNELAR